MPQTGMTGPGQPRVGLRGCERHTPFPLGRAAGFHPVLDDEHRGEQRLRSLVRLFESAVRALIHL